MHADSSPVFGLPGHELLVADMIRAEGCHVFDARGKRYLDLEAGVWCASIGHGHPRVLAALNRQAGRLAHTGFNYTCPVTAATAAQVLELLGFGAGRCVFLCSGSEAVEYGVRAAQMVLPRPLLLTMADSYCGAYGSAHAKRPDEWFTFDWTRCRNCERDRRCTAGCPHFDAIPFDQIGGFLLEPGSSSGLVRFPPTELVQALAARVQRDGGLVLVNEVTTGIGRTGAWFGFNHYGITPDIVAMGKGLGAGYPVSVTAFSGRAAGLLGDRTVPYSQSHQNDPLGAAVAGAVLDVIREEDLVERGRRLGAFLLARLRGLTSDRIAAVRGRGLMMVVELRDDDQLTFTAKVHRALAEQGFLVGRRAGVPVLRLDPPLTVPEDDLAKFLQVLAELLAEP